MNNYILINNSNIGNLLSSLKESHVSRKPVVINPNEAYNIYEEILNLYELKYIEENYDSLLEALNKIRKICTDVNDHMV